MREVISHYQIVRKLGRGGMGEVYLAKDSKLHRLVALKVIAPEAAGDANRAKRFTREAHAASGLNHPNIAVIHEIGEAEDSTPFIAMEYVEGQTIAEKIASGPIDIAQIIDLGSEIADALDEAHSKGVIHRDLKPSNVVVTPRGHAKVLDFGLAKLTSIGPDTATDVKSDPGLVVGTVNYMSPEQALGREVDPRSDLFSFGILLYEMAAARHAFDGASSTEVIERIVHSEPDAISRFNYGVPQELERIIRKCLQKDREWRYQSAREVVVDLKSLKRSSDSHPVAASPRPRRKWIAVVVAALAVLAAAAALSRFWPRKAAAGDKAMTSIAVLPFSSLGSDAAVPRLEFGLPDEVITILSYNPGVAVRPFATTRRLGDSDPAQVGRSLNVEKIITGHYSTDGGELDVTLEAIDVASNRVVWRNSVNANELMSLRKALSMQVRNGLLPALGVAARSADPAQPKSSEAYGLYLEALSAPTDPQPTREALPKLERAVALDPSYAPAWAELARRAHYDALYGEGGAKSLQQARFATGRALALDPELISAVLRSITLRVEGGDVAGGYRQARELVQRRPRSADALFALSYALRYAGQLDESARQCETAFALDPSPELRSCGITYLMMGNYDRARDFIRLDAGSEWTATLEVSILLRSGRKDDALKLLRAFPRPRSRWIDEYVRCFERGAFDTRFADKYEPAMVSSLDPEPIYFTSTEMIVCGSKEQALHLLRTALDHKYSIYPAMDKDPLLKELRGDPRYLDIRAGAVRYYESLVADIHSGVM